jgi:membrane protease YdiL (CAAX protease family)
MVLVGMIFALLFQGLWFLISFLIGSRFEIVSFPSLRGYEDYAVYSLPAAFVLYLVFAVFGAFAEEVAYRGYVQTRISSRYGYVAGIFVATLLFSLQHIHIFQLSWVEKFVQAQLVHVLLLGIFVGYLFFRSKENVWSVFSFHALNNIFAVSLPVLANTAFPFANQFADIASFIVTILLLRYLL